MPCKWPPECMPDSFIGRFQVIGSECEPAMVKELMSSCAPLGESYIFAALINVLLGSSLISSHLSGHMCLHLSGSVPTCDACIMHLSPSEPYMSCLYRHAAQAPALTCCELVLLSCTCLSSS